jgi:AcrR family transcriptional regulator
MARKPGPGLDAEQVLRAAGALVDEEGWEQLSLTRLAERLNIRTPSLYNHIASLEQLRRDLGLMAAREMLARMAQAAQGKSRSEAIHAVANAYRAYAQEHPGLYFATLRAPDPEDAEFQAVARETMDLLVGLLKPYSIVGDMALHVVRALRSLAHGFVSLELLGGFGLPLELDRSYWAMLEVFVEGLTGQPDDS